MKSIFKVFSLILASSFGMNALAQNTQLPIEKYRKFSKADPARNSNWVGTLFELGASGVVGIASLERYLQNQENLRAMIRKDAEGLQAINLDHSRFQKIWDTNFPKEMQEIHQVNTSLKTAERNLRDAKERLKEAKLQLKLEQKAMTMTSKVELIESLKQAAEASKANIAREAYLVEFYQKTAQTIAIQLNELKLDFSKTRTALILKTNLTPKTAQLSRTLRGQLFEELKNIKSNTVAGMSIGGILLIDSFIRLVILSDDRAPGFAPLVFGTSN